MKIRDQIIEANRAFGEAIEWLAPFMPWLIGLAVLLGIGLGIFSRP